MNLIIITMCIGLLGAFFMFLGDMSLYYDKDGFDVTNAQASIIEIMKKVGTKRLYIGGLLGPLSAFLYVFGYYHILLFTRVEYGLLAFICFLVLCLGIVFAAAYHSQCANLGLIGRCEHIPSMQETLNYTNLQKKFVFTFLGIGNLLLAILIGLGYTILPQWMILFSPLAWMFWLPLLNKLPKKLHIILVGGWFNLVSVLYYGSALITFFLL
ncbi:MAG: hypothetical protein Q4A47_01390 [Erysipelotrichaceae bacterium]|nr:hypothetical protein [Erysipelotrichaceae bacterium]